MKVRCMKLLPANMRSLIGIICFACAINNTFAQTVIPPDVSYVSLNPFTNEVTVAWYQSPTDNIAFTRVHYIYDETGLIKAKTIQDIAGNSDAMLQFKTDSMAIFPFEAQEVPLSFAVDAYSTNGNNSTSLREYHTTMNAKINMQNCPSQIQLTWSPYIGYDISVESYKIIEVDELNTEQIILLLSPTQLSANIALNSHAQRRFFIEAHFTDIRGNKKISQSNMVTITTPIYTSPSFIRIESLKTNQTNDIQIDFAIDTATSFTNYQIQQSKNGSNYTKIIEIELDKTEISPYVFTQTNAFHPDTTIYYRMVAFNNCEQTIATSQSIQMFTNIATEALDTKHVCTWNMPSIWTEGVAQYKIYRISQGETELVGTSINANTFIDDIGTNYAIGSEVCYYIEAVQNKSEEPQVSISNTSCIQKTYRLVLPNAINPTSKIQENREFKATYAFISGSYLLQIFDRYGNCMFESHNIDEGWNGTFKGKYVQAGSYHYKMHITLPDGKHIDRNGSVTVVFD